MWDSGRKWGAWHAVCKNDWKMCRRAGDAVEGRDRHKYVLYANAACRGCWLKLLMKAEDMFPFHHLGCSAIDKPIVDAATSLARGTAWWQVVDISDSSQGDTARQSLWAHWRLGLRLCLLVVPPPWPFVIRHREVILEGPKVNVSH